MTQAEDQELQRLQVNIRRLVDIVAEQSATLAQLKELLQQRDEELRAMQEELKSMRRNEATLAGSSLMGSSVNSTAASASSPTSPRLSQHLSPRYSQRPNSLGPPRPATDIYGYQYQP